MKRFWMLAAGLAAVTLVGAGCMETTSHDRYRQMTYRRVFDADILGFQDDVDVAVLLNDRPTHLSEWYNR
jgi:hypothetical protein